MAEAASLAETALGLALAGHDNQQATRALLLLASIHVHHGAAGQARASLEQALPLAASSPQLRAEVETALAKLFSSTTDFEQAWPRFAEALELYRQQGNLRGQAEVLMNQATAQRQLGELAAAQALRLKALELARTLGDRRLESWLLGNIANFHNHEGRCAEAIELLRLALQIAAETGDRASSALFHGNLGVCYGGLGRHAEELAQYELALAEHRALGAVRETGVTLTNLTDLHLRLGRPEIARPLAEEAVQLLAQTGDRIWQGWSLGQLGRACHLNCDPNAGERHYHAAAELLRGVGETPTLVDLLLEWISVRLDSAGAETGWVQATPALLAEARKLAASGDRRFDRALQSDLQRLEKRWARLAAATVQG